MIGILPSPSQAKPQARDRPRDYISYSAVTTYQACPLRYYFRYVAGLPERTVSSSLVFGSAVHRAVELHFNELLPGTRRRRPRPCWAHTTRLGTNTTRLRFVSAKKRVAKICCRSRSEF